MSLTLIGIASGNLKFVHISAKIQFFFVQLQAALRNQFIQGMNFRWIICLCCLLSSALCKVSPTPNERNAGQTHNRDA